MSSGEQVVLALDCGSTNFKAAVFDRSLRCLGECQEPLRYIAAGPQRVEFDPEEAWRISLRLMHSVCADAGVALERMSRVALTSQASTFCALDKAGRCLIPFISWQDQRSFREAAILNRRLGRGFHQHTSWPCAMAGLQAATLLWLRTHRPPCLRNAAALATVPGFLAMRLGIPNSVDVNLASMSGLYSLKTGRWWRPMLDICGVRERQLPSLVPLGQPLKPTARCRDLPLSKKAQVILGGNDQTAGAFGNFCGRNHMLVTLGTALVAYRVVGRHHGPYTAKGCWGPYPGGRYYELATCNDGCAALDWARARLAPGQNMKDFTALAKSAAVRREVSEERQAEAFFYPQAIRTRRAWVGSPAPGARALSVFEGIGFTLKQLIVDDLGGGKRVSDIRVIGGGSANAFWLQVLADILNTRIARGTGNALFGAARQAYPRAMGQQEADGIYYEPRDAEAYAARYARWKQGGK